MVAGEGFEPPAEHRKVLKTGGFLDTACPKGTIIGTNRVAVQISQKSYHQNVELLPLAIAPSSRRRALLAPGGTGHSAPGRKGQCVVGYCFWADPVIMPFDGYVVKYIFLPHRYVACKRVSRSISRFLLLHGIGNKIQTRVQPNHLSRQYMPVGISAAPATPPASSYFWMHRMI